MPEIKLDKQTAQDKIKEFQKLKIPLEEELVKAKLEKAMNKDADYETIGWEFEYRVECLQKQIEALDWDINRFKWYAKPPSQHKNSFDIDGIKQNFKIETLLGQPVRRSGQRSYYKCVIHQENTPSLVVYEKQNSFHCFGCQAGGSVIDLYMAVNSCDFKEAIKNLNYG